MKEDAIKFVCFLADKETTLTDLCKVGPALSLLHTSQGHSSQPVIKDNYLQLLLSGAKREAAAKKPKPMKATCLTKTDIYKIMSGLWPKGMDQIDPSVDLITWRTSMKIYTMYRTWCRWDGYSNLTNEDISLDEDSVTVFFVKAKNDQFCAGSSCTLPILGPQHVMCPKLLFSTYFQVMQFNKGPGQYLNCRIAFRQGVQCSKPKEKLGYTTSIENSRALLSKYGLEGKYSEKSFKVAGVSEAFNQGISVEDAMFHGRWKSVDTPGIYCHQSKKKRLDVASLTTK